MSLAPISASLRRLVLVGFRRPQGSRRGKPVCYTFFQAKRVDVPNCGAYSYDYFRRPLSGPRSCLGSVKGVALAGAVIVTGWLKLLRSMVKSLELLVV